MSASCSLVCYDMSLETTAVGHGHMLEDKAEESLGQICPFARFLGMCGCGGQEGRGQGGEASHVLFPSPEERGCMQHQ